MVGREGRGTYQADTEEQNLKEPPNGGGAGYVAVPHGGHGHHEEIDALPIAKFLYIAECRRVPAIFKLKET